MDRLEDMNSSLEKEVSVSKRELEEVLGEKALLGEEADQLKLVLKRELDRMEAELRTKDAIISDYKNIPRYFRVNLTCCLEKRTKRVKRVKEMQGPWMELLKESGSLS